MAVNINASTSSGIGLSSDNSGVIQFQSNGSNTVNIAANGTLTAANVTATANATVTGRVTAGNVTLSSGGSITFPDATTQSTAPVAGAWTKVAVSNVTSSTANVIFTNLGSYNSLRITISDFRPVTDGSGCTMQFSSDNGATYISTGYRDAANAISNPSGGGSNFNFPVSQGGIGNAATDGGFATTLNIIDFGKAQKTKITNFGVRFDTSGSGNTELYVGLQESQTALNALRIYADSGNVAQALILVEGWTGS